MDKDRTIVVLVNKIKRDPSFAHIQVVDYWDADLCAIGFKVGDKMVYVNTYNYLQEGEVRYDIDLEVLSDGNQYKVEKTLKGISESQLWAEMKGYLLE